MKFLFIDFLRLLLRRKVLEHFSFANFYARENSSICQFIIWLRVTAEGLFGTPFYFLADQKCCFTAICGGVIMLSKISQFQNMTKIYHIEHKSQRYFHRDIFFFSTVAARMLRISPLIVIYKRPVYLFLTRRWSNSTLVLLSSTVLRFCGASKEVK